MYTFHKLIRLDTSIMFSLKLTQNNYAHCNSHLTLNAVYRIAEKSVEGLGKWSSRVSVFVAHS